MLPHVIKEYATEKGVPLCLHENKFFRMMFNGYFHYLDPVRYARGAIVVPRFSNGDLLLVQQQRAPLLGLTIEFPRGGLEPAEDGAVGACRELQEETGHAVAPTHAVFIGKIAPDTATINGTMETFLVNIPLDTEAGAFDTDEIARYLRVSEAEFLAMVRRGDICDGMTLAAWTLVQVHPAR